MPYCARCGVEVDSHVQVCPLCRTPIMKLEDLPSSQSAWPHPSHGGTAKVFASPTEQRARAFWLVTTLLLVPALVLLAVDLFASGHLTWSLIPGLALAAAFLYLIAGFRFYNGFLGLTSAFVVITAVFLLGLDVLDGPKSWFLALGLPILVLLIGVLFAAYFVILKVKTKGYNVIATVLLALSVYCAGLDGLISMYTAGLVRIGWSMIVVLILIPLALYLFFLHYGLKRALNFHRTFHV